MHADRRHRGVSESGDRVGRVGKAGRKRKESEFAIGGLESEESGISSRESANEGVRR